MVWVNHCEVVEPRIVGTKSEPAESIKTITDPEAIPGLQCGSTMRRCVRHHGLPRSSAASIWLLSSEDIAL